MGFIATQKKSRIGYTQNHTQILMKSPLSRIAPFFLLLILGGLGFFVFNRGKGGITPDSPQYAEIVSAFYVGLGALESGESRALEKFARVTELAPSEAAGWANLGLLQLRNNQLEEAAQSLGKALALAPKSAEIESLHGILESKRANSEAAIKHFKHAVELQQGRRHDRKTMPPKSIDFSGIFVFQSSQAAIARRQVSSMAAITLA